MIPATIVEYKCKLASEGGIFLEIWHLVFPVWENFDNILYYYIWLAGALEGSC